jgi:hypothetical protein
MATAGLKGLPMSVRTPGELPDSFPTKTVGFGYT